MCKLKSLTLAIVVLTLVFIGVALSEESFLEKDNIPSLRRAFPSDPEKFTFAIIGDKTGGGEENWPIFDRAVEEVNQLDPDFAMTVGDHIQGYTADPAVIKSMWAEYMEHLSRLKMPTILVPGNHDISNTAMYSYWKENLGRTLYSFDYKGCHFLAINTEEYAAPEGAKAAEKALVDFAVSDIEKNKGARHIFIFMHKPLWRDSKIWEPIESALEGANCTVFAGHYHQLIHERRDNRTYMVLSATGAGLDEIPAPQLGLFHHFTLVSVEGSDAAVAVIRPGNILPEAVSTKEFQDRLAASIIQLRPEMPVPQAGETVSGRLIASLSNKVDKPIRMKIDMIIPDETLWKISPKEMVIETDPGAERQSAFELVYKAESISTPPKYIMEAYYDGKSLGKHTLNISFADTTSMRKVDKWMIAGPFNIPDGKDKNPTEAENVVYDYFPVKLEPETDSSLSRTYKIGDKTIYWQAESADEKGTVDLDRIYNSADYAVAYTQAFIHSPSDATVWGTIMADDIASVFFNGAQVSPVYKLRDLSWQYVFFPVALKAGWNQVMVKCADCYGGWVFNFGLDDPGAQLKFSVQPPPDSGQ